MQSSGRVLVSTFASHLHRIQQVIVVTRDTHKKIILGKGGQTIKTVGAEARKELEQLLGHRVHLFIHVKVREKWAEEQARLREIGEEGVLALVSDSTNAYREGRSPSEQEVAHEIADVVASAQGRVVSVLEGGYELTALAESVEWHIRALSV